LIEREAESTPGVTGVFSELRVELPPPVPQPVPVQASPIPPKPPSPVTASPPPTSPAGSQPARSGPVGEDAEQLSRRIYEVLATHPVLKSLSITVNSNRGVVTLTGKVPSAYEAMLAYRTTEQTPGVDSIIDELEIPPPDDIHPNPLRQEERSEDVEPFLTSRIRRYVDDFAHIDRVFVANDLITIRGSLLKVEEKDRVEAMIRSMALLRGFRLTLILTPYDQGDG